MSGGDWKDLYKAAETGDLALLQHHLSEGVNPNYQHPEVQCTPLVASLIHGHLDIAHCLLKQGADPNLLSDFDGLTPLQAARQFGHVAFEKLLVELGATELRKPFWARWLPV